MMIVMMQGLKYVVVARLDGNVAAGGAQRMMVATRGISHAPRLAGKVAVITGAGRRLAQLLSSDISRCIPVEVD